MKLVQILIIYILTAIASAASSDSSSSSTTSKTSAQSSTLVWVTGTNSAGNTVTTQSIYSQKFPPESTVAVSVSSALAGLGTISGQVGQIRHYSTTTVKNNAVLGQNPYHGQYLWTIFVATGGFFGILVL